MRQNITIEFDLVQREDIEPQYKELIESAIAAKGLAYAPFSNFYVGCSALLESGEIVSGANQESEVYPSGMCAERVLLYHLQTRINKEPIEAIAVTASPCGACREVLLNTEHRVGKNIKLFIIKDNGIHIFNRIEDIVPFAFRLE